jgi:hypothetical protein
VYLEVQIHKTCFLFEDLFLKMKRLLIMLK